MTFRLGDPCNDEFEDFDDFDGFVLETLKTWTVLTRRWVTKNLFIICDVSTMFTVLTNLAVSTNLTGRPAVLEKAIRHFFQGSPLL